MAFQEEHHRILPDGRGSTPDPSIKINEDRSLALAEVVEHIEAQTGHVISLMDARVHRRPIAMPVTTPVPNVDRFDGHGDQLTEHIAYERANRQRLATHGIIWLFVHYVGIAEGQEIYYHF